MPAELTTSDKIAALAFLVGFPGISTGINTLGAQMGNSILNYIGEGLANLNSPNETISIAAQSSAIGYAAFAVIMLCYEMKNKATSALLLDRLGNQLDLLLAFDVLGAFFLPFLAQWHNKNSISSAAASGSATAAGAIPIYLFAYLAQIAFKLCYKTEGTPTTEENGTRAAGENPTPEPQRNGRPSTTMVNIYTGRDNHSRGAPPATTEVRAFSP